MEVTNKCSNTSNISGTVEEYLRHLQDNTNITMIPAVIMLAIFSTTGLIGNSLVLVVYSQKMKLNPTKVFIMTIASFDLVANVAAIPSEANIMFDSWNFQNPGVCKSKVFLGVFTTVGGAISLLLVAVIRYRKVCHPYGWQVNVRQTIIASVVTAIIAFLFCIPYIIIYGIKTRETPCPYISGTECFADDQFFYTIWPLLNNLLFVALYLFLSISMVVLYILIGVTAYKHRIIPGEASKCKNDSSSTPGLSSVEKEVDDAQKKSPKINKRPCTNVSHSDYGKIKARLCCIGQPEEEITNDKNQSTVTMKTFTMTDSETGEEISETIDSELTQDDVYEFGHLVFRGSLDLNITFTNLAIPENFESYKDTEFGAVFQKEECASVSDDNNTQEGNAIEKVLHNEQSEEIQRQECKISKNNANLKTISSNITVKPKADQQNTRRRPLGRMTAMLIIISAIFVIGYFPFLMLTVYKNRLPEQYANLNMVELTFYNLFYRLYFLNSAANPIIYSLCDLTFRRECFRLLNCKLKRRWSIG